jgi:Cof subfamily protein (haloacid dehalogenase superfamily)
MKPYTAPSRISLVLADVDGTLVTHEKVLTDRTKAAVARLHERGILFAITSGRPPAGMRMFTDALHLTTPIAGFNGGVFVQPDCSVIESHFISKEATVDAIKVIEKHGLVAWLYTATDWYVPDPKGPHVDREAWTVKFDPKVAKDFAPYLDKAVKIVGVSDDLAAVQAAEADAKKTLGSHAAAARSQPYYLDVTHPNATKGGVVDFLCDHLKIPKAEMATLGDMPNDVPMFEKSGLSIAMGNAAKDVQEQANFVTASCDDEGFALALEKYILQSPGNS